MTGRASSAIGAAMNATRIDRGSAFRAAIVLIPLLELLGGLAARVAGSTADNPWYRTLTLPLLQPPGFVFGIAWSILYALMGLAAALVWAHKGAPGRIAALSLFTTQLLLNLCWSPLFFRYHQIWAALALIVVILVLAIWTTFRFARISRTAAWLMVPYLVWLGFAIGLNARVGQLNPAASPPLASLLGG